MTTTDTSTAAQRLLLAHFETMADAPGGVARLRRLILQLAVQGRLVEQDPADEPASALLERIRAEKAQLVREGRLKKVEPELPTVIEEQPFEVPLSWRWTRLANLCWAVTDGDHQPPPKALSGVPFLVISNVSSGRINFEDHRSVTQSYYDGLDEIKKPDIGDILYTVTGSYGISVLVDTDTPFCVQRHIGIIKPSRLLEPQWLQYVLKSGFVFNQATACATGIAQKTVPLGGLRQFKIPLPPLAEQRRIVERVDALMALCDALEERQARRGEERRRLLSVLVDALLGARDAGEAAATWARLSESFALVLDAPEDVAPLRQAVLQLAVQGRLVEQDPADEPASVLLERIQELRHSTHLRVNGKRSKETSAVEPIDLDNEVQRGILPPLWQWCKVEHIATVCLGGTPARDEATFWNGNIPWVSSGEVANCRISSTKEHITKAGLKNSNAKIYPPNTVLIAMIGQGKTRGQSAILDIEACTNQNVAGLVFDAGNVFPEYVWLWALGEYERTRSGGRGGAQPALNGQKIRSLWLPLPPLAEQRRIVARVEQLMALCDALEARLREGRGAAERLAEALCAAVAGASQGSGFRVQGSGHGTAAPGARGEARSAAEGSEVPAAVEAPETRRLIDPLPPERVWAGPRVAPPTRGHTDDNGHSVAAALLAERGTLTNGELQAALGLDGAAARAVLKGLVAAGIARQEGERRGTRYVWAGQRREALSQLPLRLAAEE